MLNIDFKNVFLITWQITILQLLIYTFFSCIRYTSNPLINLKKNSNEKEIDQILWTNVMKICCRNDSLYIIAYKSEYI